MGDGGIERCYWWSLLDSWHLMLLVCLAVLKWEIILRMSSVISYLIEKDQKVNIDTFQSRNCIFQRAIQPLQHLVLHFTSAIWCGTPSKELCKYCHFPTS